MCHVGDEEDAFAFWNINLYGRAQVPPLSGAEEVASGQTRQFHPAGWW